MADAKAKAAQAEAQAQAELNDFPSLFSLKGKIAVVTGGSRGLGLHAASAFLQAGAAKVFISSRKAAACEEACRALNALPNRQPGAVAIPVPADSANIKGVEHLLAEVRKHVDRVDILFANAGASWGEAFDTHPDSAFAKVMDLNVKAVFNTIRLFAPLLQKAAKPTDPSRVLITASVAGLGIGTLGKQGTYGYSASKAAVIHLGRNLAIELGPRHITVNSLCPGFFPTKMANGLLDIAGGADKIGASNPMGRLGKPEDIAGAVVYLASRAGSHVNGEAIAIDGGAMWAKGELALTESKL
jgi:NAD(P)-dependent dehydrogenase (short-subunit alcohol dehydrogenase family)